MKEIPDSLLSQSDDKEKVFDYKWALKNKFFDNRRPKKLLIAVV